MFDFHRLPESAKVPVLGSELESAPVWATARALVLAQVWAMVPV